MVLGLCNLGIALVMMILIFEIIIDLSNVLTSSFSAPAVTRIIAILFTILPCRDGTGEASVAFLSSDGRLREFTAVPEAAPDTPGDGRD